MIRALVTIAIAGFVLSFAALTAAFAIGGPDIIERSGWRWAGGWDNDHWNSDWDFGGSDDHERTATRSFTWDGSDRLSLSVPADITYTQAKGPGKVTITGSPRTLERLEVGGGRIGLKNGGWNMRKVRIVMTAPGVRSFDLSGANHLTIVGYDQKTLSLDMSGASGVVARGRTDDVEVDISGAGRADLGELKTRDVQVDISGAGQATVAPTGRADLRISGMGEIELLSEPASLETDISGAGRIRHGRTPPPAGPSGPKTRT